MRVLVGASQMRPVAVRGGSMSEESDDEIVGAANGELPTFTVTATARTRSNLAAHHLARFMREG
jgi:hypothetical protein